MIPAGARNIKKIKLKLHKVVLTFSVKKFKYNLDKQKVILERCSFVMTFLFFEVSKSYI